MVPLCFEVDATASTSTSGRLVNLGVRVAQVSFSNDGDWTTACLTIGFANIASIFFCMVSLIYVPSCMAKAFCIFLVGIVFGTQDLSNPTD